MSAPARVDFGGFARAALFALTPAAAAGGGLALAPLLGLTGAASIRPSLLRADLTRPPLWLVLLALFTAWLALSALWSPYDDAQQALRFALTLATGLLFARGAGAAPHLTMFAGLAAIVVLAALLAIEAIADMPLNRAANPGLLTWQLAGNPGRGAAVLTALIWAGAGWLTLRGARWAAALALIIAAALAMQFGQTANILAFLVGALAFGLGYAAPRLGVYAISAVWTLWLLAAPLISPLIVQVLAGGGAPYSWIARTEIWRYVSARIAERPWLGHGLDASRADTGEIVVHGQTVSAIPLHPHSASLHIWYETGAVGAVLAAACLLLGARALSRAAAGERALAAASCGVLGAVGVIANISFGAWQEWWNATILIAAGLIAALFAMRQSAVAPSARVGHN